MGEEAQRIVGDETLFFGLLIHPYDLDQTE